MSKRKTQIAVVAAIAATVLGVAACGSSNASAPNGDAEGTFGVVSVNVHGTDVECVTFDNYNGGGVSCNWEKYNSETVR